MARRSSPGRSTLRPAATTKSATATRRSSPCGVQIVHTPSSAVVSEIIGPAGNDMQRLPPTVAMFQILNEARNDRQHWLTSGAAVQCGGNVRPSSSAILQVAAMRRPCSLTCSVGQPSSAMSISREIRSCGSENNQVPPASQASPAFQAGNSARWRGLAISVMVLRSIAMPTVHDFMPPMRVTGEFVLRGT